MRPPKWIKPAYVEIFCGFILFLFTFIEFNNRNALFVSGEWELSQTQYVIEWITLLILLFLLSFTLRHLLIFKRQILLFTVVYD